MIFIINGGGHIFDIEVGGIAIDDQLDKWGQEEKDRSRRSLQTWINSLIIMNRIRLNMVIILFFRRLVNCHPQKEDRKDNQNQGLGP